MSVTVVQDVNRLDVVGQVTEVTVQAGSGSVTVVEQPVTLTVTQVAPTIEVASTGVQGAPGPQGPAGPAGDEAGLGYVHTQSSPALLVQIQHGFLFKPAGVVAVENDGYSTEWATLSHPATGITELTFGVPFSGVVYVS